jgi:hypothetical protein
VPFGAGFVDSLARPGGNATGFVQYEYDLGGKWLELLKEIVPRVTRAAVLRDAAITAGVGLWEIGRQFPHPIAIRSAAAMIRILFDLYFCMSYFSVVFFCRYFSVVFFLTNELRHWYIKGASNSASCPAGISAPGFLCRSARLRACAKQGGFKP